MKITLPIFFPKEETAQLQSLGIKGNFEEDNETRPFTFYEVKALVEYRGENRNYTTVLANGDAFICSMPKEEVEQLVDHEMKMDALGT